MMLVMIFSLAQPTNFPLEKQEAVKAVFKKYVDMGFPGMALTVYNQETGFWSHAEGMSNLEHSIPLTPEHLFYLQSVSKTYMAVLILQLYQAK